METKEMAEETPCEECKRLMEEVLRLKDRIDDLDDRAAQIQWAMGK